MVYLQLGRAEKEKLIKVLNAIFEDKEVSFMTLELNEVQTDKDTWLEIGNPIIGQLFTLNAPGLKLVPKN